MDYKELGNLGEKLVCQYLTQEGYVILATNFRNHFGEIDIIAKKRWKFFKKNDKTIHIIEVKTLKNIKDFFPEDRVDSYKRHKLKRLAESWLSLHKYPEDYPYQIDLAGVVVNPETRLANINYFKNAVGD